MGRPDVVNRQRKVAIFVDGDFWHGNPEEWKRRGFTTMEEQFAPSKRAAWSKKLRKNVERDEIVTATLQREGWTVLRVWESEVRRDPDSVANQVAALW